MSTVSPHIAAPAILVAHGSTPERDWLTQLLTARGYRVTSCDNGIDALKGISAERFSLVMTAVTMPHSDGLEVIRTVRERFAGTPVIAVASADPLEQLYLRSAEALGASTTWTMPVAADVILGAVADAIEGSRHRME